MIALSVISSSSSDASSLHSLSTDAMSAIKVGLSSCRAERFTLICTGGSPPSCHARASAQATSRAHLPIASISPDSSAIGMNCAGDTMPSTGWRQRISASTPVMLCVRRSIFGW